MNHKLIQSSLLALGILVASTVTADDLGISVILEKEVAPGVYGRVEIGNDSRPSVYYREPMLIVTDSRYARSRPVYLHVPPGHAKNWGKHCSKYHACDRPVYFVRSAEYDEHYHEDHESHRGKDDHPGKGKGQGNGKGKGHNH